MYQYGIIGHVVKCCCHPVH